LLILLPARPPRPGPGPRRVLYRRVPLRRRLVSARLPGLPVPGVLRRARLVPGSQARDHQDRSAAGRARGRRRGLARSAQAGRSPRRPAAVRPVLAARAPLAPRRVLVLPGPALPPVPGSAARARVRGLGTTRSARRRPAWALPRRPAQGWATVTVTVTAVTVTVTAVMTVAMVTVVTAARVPACPAGPALAGPGPAAVVPARTPTAARVPAARVPVVRVLAR
jgi:hypothetical protein